MGSTDSAVLARPFGTDEGEGGGCLEALQPILPLFGAVVDPLAIFDAQGTIRFANSGFRSLMRTDVPFWSLSAGEPTWLSAPDHAAWRRFADQQLRSGDERGAGAIRVRIVDGRGREIPVSVLAVGILAAGSVDPLLLALVKPVPLVQSAGADRAEPAGRQDDAGRQVAQLIDALGRLRRGASAGDDAAEGHDPEGDPVMAQLGQLSRREREIAEGIAAGWRVPTIASKLYLSENTVRNHLKKVYRKMGVHSCAELREVLTPALN